MRGNESGVTLLETLVALAVLGLVAVAFLNGLTTAAQATIIADRQATAESLVRSEIEHVRSQDYIDYADPEYESIIPPDPYSIELTTTPINPYTGEPKLPGEDDGVQKITVTVKHRDKVVLRVEDYKVER